MLVTQEDYTRWQSMYAQRSSNTDSATSGQPDSAGDGGHVFAIDNDKPTQERPLLANSEREKTFLENAFE